MSGFLDAVEYYLWCLLPKCVLPSMIASPIRGHFDGLLDNRLRGWVWNSRKSGEVIEIQVLVGDWVVLTRSANSFRPDLEASRIGSGRHGYDIALAPEILELSRRTKKKLTIKTVGKSPQTLGELDLTNDIGRMDLSLAATRFLRAQLDQVQALSGLSSRTVQPPTASDHSVTPPTADVARPAYQPLFRPVGVDHGISSPLKSSIRLSAYCEYIRERNLLNDRFNPDEFPADVDDFLRWYLETYSTTRSPKRIPLSATEIAYLNEPVPFDGALVAIPRVLLWYALDDSAARDLLSKVRHQNTCRDLIYWWACERAPALNAEDCLVTTEHVEFLRAAPDGFSQNDPFPISNFLQAIVKARPDLAAFGSLNKVNARVAIYLAIILDATNRQGGLIRFVPAKVIKAFFDGDGPFFDQLINSISSPKPSPSPFDSPICKLMLATGGFDLESRRFRSVDKFGNRLEAAVAPVGDVMTTAATPEYDVQIIGPFSKTSGLGAITRMSQTILSESGLRCRHVDFSMDNPQPSFPVEGISQSVGRSRINLLHLNPDMLPLAYAYLPDCFSGRYTIGFFFWELDKVASSHKLALDLVDEIWVSSEYNRRCFAAATSKSVINIGAMLPDISVPPLPQARASLRQKFGLAPDDFVAFAAYDTFSYPQRKNPLGLIHAFQDAFPQNPSTKLVIKTHNATVGADPYRAKLWQAIQKARAFDPRIIVLNETLDYNEFMALKAGADCYVSLHRSEGLGIGMLEAMQMGIPVVCTGYSGNMDFCNSNTSWLIEYDEVFVKHDEYVYAAPGHLWAQPRHDSAVSQLRAVREHADARVARAEAAKALLRERYTCRPALERYLSRLNALGIK